MLPLIPLRRAPDILRHAIRTDVETSAAFWVACCGGLIASALGEVSGYVLGQGDMGYRRITYEFERERYLRPSDLVYLRAENDPPFAAREAAGA
jgi:hypothetical protein